MTHTAPRNALSNYKPDETRYNFYRNIHKAIRLGHCRLLAALGSNDFTKDGPTALLLADLRGFLMLGKGHLEGENREIHAALEQRMPGASSHAAEGHEDHEKAFEELESLMRAVETAPRGEKEKAGRALYYRYALFAAHDFEHMNEEETELLCALQDAFSEEELHAIEGRIVAAIPAPKMAAAMSLMVPALNHGERVELLAKLRTAMPEQAFDGLLAGVIKPSIPANDYTAVIGELMLRAA
jgi:hypothetical protein